LTCSRLLPLSNPASMVLISTIFHSRWNRHSLGTRESKPPTCLPLLAFRSRRLCRYQVAAELKDWFLYCGKHKPELYFDPRARAGISAFACAQDQDEIGHGESASRQTSAADELRA